MKFFLPPLPICLSCERCSSRLRNSDSEGKVRASFRRILEVGEFLAGTVGQHQRGNARNTTGDGSYGLQNKQSNGAVRGERGERQRRLASEGEGDGKHGVGEVKVK